MVSNKVPNDTWAIVNVPNREPLEIRPLLGIELKHNENTWKSDYVWLPIEWEGEKMVLRWRDEWRI